jgi:transposase
MTAELRIPLDIPDVEIVSTKVTNDGRLIIRVESELGTTQCGICGQEIACRYGHGQERTLRHLPVLNMATYIKIRPRRGQCRECEHEPTTTQVLGWYQERSPHTKAYDQWLLKQLVNTTIEDVSMRENIGYDAVLGALDRQIEMDTCKQQPTLSSSMMRWKAKSSLTASMSPRTIVRALIRCASRNSSA